MTNLTHLVPSRAPAELTATASAQPAMPTAPPDAGPAVYWGDRIALQVWLLGCALLWLLTLSNLLSKPVDAVVDTVRADSHTLSRRGCLSGEAAQVERMVARGPPRLGMRLALIGRRTPGRTDDETALAEE